MIRQTNGRRIAKQIARLHTQRRKKGEPHPILFTGDDFHIPTFCHLTRELYVAGVIQYGSTKDLRTAFYITDRYYDLPYQDLCDKLEEILDLYI